MPVCGRCPPQFGAIFNHGPEGIIIPELCSGCDKCLPACPVNCIYPFPEWETTGCARRLVGRTSLVRRSLRVNPQPPAIIDAMTASDHRRRRTLVTCCRRPARCGRCCTASPVTRPRSAASPRRWPVPVSTSKCPCCLATAPSSMTCCRHDGPIGPERPRLPTSDCRSGPTHVVVVGLSMGGALTLRLGADHPEIAGLVCINPGDEARCPAVVEMLRGMEADGTAVLPGIGSDIADPDAKESAYEGTPIAGVGVVAGRRHRATQRSVPEDANAIALAELSARPRGRTRRRAIISPRAMAARSSASHSTAATTSRRRTTTRN